ncbi:hypothetical protein M405DRAFT_834370 [Rhizopogon salebrosus TDB-379]|nr:hypothetical protein M405DRAFT_834370 [Rhizopogon salebrosus TDB-379]
MDVKSDHVQRTMNEVLHPTLAIRSMRRNAHIFVANSPCLGQRGRHGRTRGHPIVYLDEKVVDPLRGGAVCEPVGSRYDTMGRTPPVKVRGGALAHLR